MLARAAALAALTFGLFASGCDAGTSTPIPDTSLRGDPEDEGSNHDLGAEDGLEPTPVEQHGHLRVAGTQLLNESGEEIQLKGVSSMWLNWEGDGYAEDLTALRWMRNNWKLSVIRAAMGVEEQDGYLSFPEHALEQVHRIINNAIEAGVYVIVDFHSHAAHQYEEQAIEFFSQLAEAYGGVPNLIYETFNEPRALGWEELKRYHETIVDTIREHDSEALIVLGTPNYSQGVDQAAEAPLKGDNLLYTLHYYACSHKHALRVKGDRARDMGLALFVTEFGATTADGGLHGEVCLEEAQRWHEWLADRKISWTAWKLDGCEPDSSCLLVPGAPVDGGWTDEYLHGHAKFVRGRMQE